VDLETAALRDRLQIALGSTYTLEHELGGGGMSRVFAARDARLGRRVVVKVLHPELSAGLSTHRFEREVRLAARLQHPHVLPLLSAGDLDGLPFYTMPFVEGESLRELLRREGALPVRDAARLAREIADALAYAHSQGIVHRDLKPENVLLSGGHAVIADFGVAKALSLATVTTGNEQTADTSAGCLTGVGTAVGTPAYMAPEQATGNPATDHRADLYALGLITYEALTGAHPFAGRSVHDMIAAHLTEEPPAATSPRGEVPPSLAGLVARLLAKSPDSRPQTAREVVQSLDDLTTAPSGPAAAVDRRRPNRLALAALLGVLVLLAGASALLVLRESPRGKPLGTTTAVLVDKRVVVAPFENQTGDSALRPLGSFTSDWITQGLAEAGFAEAVDLRTTQLAWRAAPNARDLAAATGARLVISGTYYLERDSVIFQARITDAAEGKLLGAVGPVSGPVSSPRQAIAMLRERTLGAIAGLLEARAQSWAVTSTLPPSLAAYERWSSGLEHNYQGEFDQAAADWMEAARLDTAWALPVLLAGAAYANGGHNATADSLFRVANRIRDRLTPSDRYLLDLRRAELRGDYAGACERVERWSASLRAPRSRLWSSPLTPGTSTGRVRPSRR